MGAAVATGLLAGLLVPSLVGTEREAARGAGREHESLPPTMPGVIGESLDRARSRLARRGISYVTDAPGIVEDTVPQILEVCGSEPGPGRRVRGSARLSTAITGTCDI